MPRARRPKHEAGPGCAKHCSCGACFSRDDLIRKRSLTVIGMMHIEGQPPSSTIYCFSHMRYSCRTSFALPVETFRDQITEPIPAQFLNGTEKCERHCARVEDLEECTQECMLAPYRRFLLKRLLPRK